VLAFHLYCVYFGATLKCLINDRTPVVNPSQRFALGQGAVNVVGTVAAMDAEHDPLANWQIIGGTGASIFAIDQRSGQITIANPSRRTTVDTPPPM
jgi:hypothetical protein